MIEDWLAEQRIRQWERGEVKLSDVRGQIAAGQWHLVRDRRVGVAAALRVLDLDPFWGPDATAAVYVHGLMVHRAVAGRGVGHELLDWAGDRGRNRGAVVLRLDCVESNTRLRAYYRAHGFVEVGCHQPPEPCPAVTLLQRAL
ncbi:MAG TPA: GNAT family N-acetyltransferase [Actinomycetes bacterium]